MQIFEKVSFEQFKKDSLEYNRNLTDQEIKDAYEKVKLPKRATTGSAGYDFYLPYDVNISGRDYSGSIPLGIKCLMDEDVVLLLCPRSGIGFKYGLMLANTIGVIDSDYYSSDNEGHTKLKLYNPGNEAVSLSAGTKIVQGIFIKYQLTDDDNTNDKRNGGFGSTD